MPTEKIADIPRQMKCQHPEHDPPGHMVFDPGVYAHTCPGCGNVITFVVPHKPTL